MKSRLLRPLFLLPLLWGNVHLATAQEWYRGVLYQPVPLPDLKEAPVFDSNAAPQRLVQIDAWLGTALPPMPVATTGDTARYELDNPGAPLLSPGFIGERNFGPLKPVANETDYPARANAKLLLHFPEGTYVGSGVLIDSRFLLTAGHCLYNPQTKRWATKVTVIPAYDYGEWPFGAAEATSSNLYVAEDWLKNGNFNWDLGLIKLDRYIGGLVGWYGYGYNTSNSYYGNGKQFHNFSYPAAPPFNGQQMHYYYGTFDQITSRIAYYNGPSYGGQSGSGYYSIENGHRIVSTIMSHSTNNNTKSGTIRLSSSIFDDIQDFVYGALPNSPNLSPMALQASDHNLTAGCDHLSTVHVLLHNYSEAAFSGKVPVRLYLSTDGNISASDRLLGTQSFSVQIAPRNGAWVTLKNVLVPSNVPGGSYYLGALLDLSDGLKSDNDSRGDDNERVQIFPAHQLSVPPLKEVSVEKGCATLSLSCNTHWEITTTADWITSISPASGTGSAEVEVCYEANEGAKDRGAPLIVKAGCLLDRVVTWKQNFAGIHVFPNPVTNSLTSITFSVPDSANVSVRLFATDGRYLATLLEEIRTPGDYLLEHDFDALPTGVYVLGIFTGKRAEACRFVKH